MESDEDSDATVGFSEPEEDETSPSLLYNKNGKNADSKIKELIQLKEDRSMDKEMSLEMSEEVPLQNVYRQTSSSEPMIVDQHGEEEVVCETQDTQRKRQQDTGQQQPDQASSQPLFSLGEVEREQLSVLGVMRTLSSFTGDEITQDKLDRLEKSLADIGAANLREKTDILSEHTQLSQSLSQLELSEGREELIERLTGLAARQKKLLACLTRQKEITTKLSEKRKQQDTLQTNLQRVIAANTIRDHVLSRHHSLSAGQAMSQHASAAVTGPTPKKRPQPHTTTKTNPQSQTTRAVPNRPQFHTAIIPSNSQSHTAASNPESHTTVVPTNPQTQSSSTIAQPASALHQFGAAKTVPISQITNPCFQPSSLQAPKLPSTTIIRPPSATASNNSSGSSGSHLQQPTLAQQSEKAHPDLSQPVPLEVLIKHKFLKPGNNCLSCDLLGCKFQASLLHSGSVVDQDGVTFSQAHQWLTACWKKLGHQRKCNRKWAYKTVLYLGTPLMTLCEQYSRKQVSSYLTQSQKTSTTSSSSSSSSSSTVTHSTSTSKQQRTQTVGLPSSNTTATNSGPKQPQNWDSSQLNHLLTKGCVLHAPPSTQATSLDLPTGFWGGKDVRLTQELSLLLNKELDWTHL